MSPIYTIKTDSDMTLFLEIKDKRTNGESTRRICSTIYVFFDQLSESPWSKIVFFIFQITTLSLPYLEHLDSSTLRLVKN